MAPKEIALIGEDGKQKSGAVRYTCDEMMTELLSIPRKWDHSFKPVLTDDKGGGKCCVLQCIHCLTKLSPSNPSGNTLDHLRRCTKYQPRRSPRQHADSSKASRSLSDDGCSWRTPREEKASQPDEWRAIQHCWLHCQARPAEAIQRGLCNVPHHQRDAFPARQQRIPAQGHRHLGSQDA